MIDTRSRLLLSPIREAAHAPLIDYHQPDLHPPRRHRRARGPDPGRRVGRDRERTVNTSPAAAAASARTRPMLVHGQAAELDTEYAGDHWNASRLGVPPAAGGRRHGSTPSPRTGCARRQSDGLASASRPGARSRPSPPGRWPCPGSRRSSPRTGLGPGGEHLSRYCLWESSPAALRPAGTRRTSASGDHRSGTSGLVTSATVCHCVPVLWHLSAAKPPDAPRPWSPCNGPPTIARVKMGCADCGCVIESGVRIVICSDDCCCRDVPASEQATRVR